jgi:mannonate dehydratase
MRLGFGFYSHMLTPENYRFAAQCGATHAIVHLVDYTYGGSQESVNKDEQPIGDGDGWGIAGKNTELWNASYLSGLVKELASYGLTLEAIENLDPADWYDVLLGGPRRDEQLEVIKNRIRAVGQAGIPIIGYNFSLAGVASRISGKFARGGAVSVGMNAVDERPIPDGMVWNMWYDIGRKGNGKVQPSATEQELWDRWRYFMDAVLPVAEENGVTLAAHPDDPPVQSVRQQPKLVWRPEHYQRIIDHAPSPNNKLEFCIGTLAEMPDHDIYETVARYAEQDRIAYVHFRNIAGHAPNYTEQFVDDGEVDMGKVTKILAQSQFDGTLIADHTPEIECAAPWYAGMAFAMGNIKAQIAMTEEQDR